MDGLKRLIDLQRRIRLGLAAVDCGTPMADGMMSARRGEAVAASGFRAPGARIRGRVTDSQGSGGRQTTSGPRLWL